MANKEFTPREIYRPIGMESGRLNYLVRRGTITADAHQAEAAGSANKFSATEAAKAALVNYCDHLGMDIQAGEALVAFATRPEVLEPIVSGDADYIAVMQGMSVIAFLPNTEQLPGGPEMGRTLYPADKFTELRPLPGVTLFVLAEAVTKLSCVTYLNMSMLFRFFGEKIGFAMEDLLTDQK